MMKKSLCFLSLLLSLIHLAVAQSRRVHRVDQFSDTTIRVLYIDEINRAHGKEAAIFVDGVFQENRRLLSEKSKDMPEAIEKIDAIKRDTIIDQVYYPAQVHVTLKQDIVLPPYAGITLADFAKEHIKEGITNKIYFLDGELLNYLDTDYHILPSKIGEVEVEKSVSVHSDGHPVHFIRILTKEYLRSRPIYIRGGTRSTK